MRPSETRAEIQHTRKSVVYFPKPINIALQCVGINSRTKEELSCIWPFYDQNN